MKKIIILTSLLFVLSAAGAYKARAMLEIPFKIGNNIVITAKATGVPKFSVTSIDGLIQYSAMKLPSDAYVIYERKGYEIRSKPVFSINFSADRSRSPNDLVDTFLVKMETDQLRSHSDARSMVTGLVAQFKNGMWARHINPDCPAVTGRSSFLDADGEIDGDSCGLDAEYQIEPDDWIRLFINRQSYDWIAENVLARLTIEYKAGENGPRYDIRLLFEDYAVKLIADRENEQRRRKDGDVKGWNTTAKAVASEKVIAERNAILEANALRRGDKVLVRVENHK